MPRTARKQQPRKVAFVLGGASLPAFPGESRDLDFFDAKGALEQLFAVVGVRAWHLGGPGPPPLHPGAVTARVTSISTGIRACQSSHGQDRLHSLLRAAQ